MRKEKTAKTAEDTAEAAADAEAAGLVAAEEASAPGKCTKRPVQTVDRSAKFLSSRPTAGPFTAGTATKSTRSSRVMLLRT
jgi:hypothetical protein